MSDVTFHLLDWHRVKEGEKEGDISQWLQNVFWIENGEGNTACRMYPMAFQLFKVKSYYVDSATITNKTEARHGSSHNVT